MATCRSVKVLAALVAIAALGGCASLGDQPGTELPLLPGLAGAVFELPSMLDEDKLRVVLEVDKGEYAVGDSFYWYAKVENPTLKDAKLTVYGEAAGDLLRFDQTGGLFPVRSGARYVGTRASGLAGDHVIAPEEVKLFEGRGQLVQGDKGQILVRFPDMEIVLPGPGTYDVYLPVRVDWFRRYAVGRRMTIREETRSNVETITIK